jgi:3-oxoacyl-[acyl-carrier-protein] synthase II
VGRRAVITGVGLVTPNGLDARSSWEAVLQGRSGIGPITKFDTARFSVRIAGEVKNFDPLQYLDRKEARKFDTFVHYAVAASHQAIKDSGFPLNASGEDRVGVLIGSGIGGLPLIEAQHREMMERGPDRISPFFIPGVIVNMATGLVSIKFRLRGPNVAVCTACSTGAHAIGDAAKLIQRGEADAMIAGGTEAVITPMAVGGFSAMKALSRRNDAPEKASRPFDRDRDGFVMGEGAGVVFLEEYEAALARGAHIYAEVAGYGLSGDGYHITAPPPDGGGAVRAMRAALHDAGMDPREVDYVNAHGTSTPQGDEIETQAIKTVFAEHAKELRVSSTKSMTGHLLGAAGGVETAFCAMALRDGVAPPTINLDNPSEGCDLHYVPHRAEKRPLRAAMNNSFGFGGTNAALILKKI